LEEWVETRIKGLGETTTKERGERGAIHCPPITERKKSIAPRGKKKKYFDETSRKGLAAKGKPPKVMVRQGRKACALGEKRGGPRRVDSAIYSTKEEKQKSVLLQKKKGGEIENSPKKRKRSIPRIFQILGAEGGQPQGRK